MLSACQASVKPGYPRDDMINDPDMGRYSICYGHSCRFTADIRLSPGQWQGVVDIFASPANSAEMERTQIAHAVAEMERLSAVVSGKIHDLGGNAAGLGQPGQTDCIDESVNTSTYLRMFEQAGLLRWHHYVGRITRGLPQLSWPHNTALIEETATKSRYAVDSWFHDNGRPPEIVLLKPWMEGWRPGTMQDNDPSRL